MENLAVATLAKAWLLHRMGHPLLASHAFRLIRKLGGSVTEFTERAAVIML